jgi:hypothetical protein
MSAIYRHTYGEHNLISQVESSLSLAINCYRSLSDTCIGMSGMSGYKYRYFINNVMKRLVNPRYLEVGVMAGSSLCSAIDGVYGVEALGIDRYSLGNSSLEQAEANVASVITDSSSVSIIDRDFLSVNFTGRGPFNVYLYDCGRAQGNYESCLVHAESALADDLLFIVGDWDHCYGGVDSELNTGVRASIAQAGYNICYHVDVQTGSFYETIGSPSSEVESTPWQNGYGIFVLSRSALVPVESVAEENYEV